MCSWVISAIVNACLSIEGPTDGGVDERRSEVDGGGDGGGEKIECVRSAELNIDIVGLEDEAVNTSFNNDGVWDGGEVRSFGVVDKQGSDVDGGDITASVNASNSDVGRAEVGAVNTSLSKDGWEVGGEVLLVGEVEGGDWFIVVEVELKEFANTDGCQAGNVETQRFKGNICFLRWTMLLMRNQWGQTAECKFLLWLPVFKRDWCGGGKIWVGGSHINSYRNNNWSITKYFNLPILALSFLRNRVV